MRARLISSPILVLIGTLAAATYLVGMALELTAIKLLVKGIPVLAMAIWVWPDGNRKIAVGLVFGALGDILLNIPGGFLAGMVAFALGHGLYVWAFVGWNSKLQAFLAIPVFAYLLLPMSLMLDGTGPLTVPVVLYMLIIGAMIWRATASAYETEPVFPLRWAAMAGALLFAFSDTLIGINRFVTPLPGAAFPIILTYWTGQWLIAASGKLRT